MQKMPQCILQNPELLQLWIRMVLRQPLMGHESCVPHAPVEDNERSLGLKLLVRFYCRHLQQCLDWNGEHGELHRNGPVDATRSLKRLGMKLQWRPEATR